MAERFSAISGLWAVLSRTRPLAPSVPLSLQTPTPKAAFCLLIYRGLGVTTPLLLCYVVGIVANQNEGAASVALATFAATVTSIMTGLCYSEFVSSRRQSSGSVSTALYQLVGELPAFCAAVFHLLIACGFFAIMSKALSSTLESLSHERWSAFVSSRIGNLPLSGLPPDILAFGAVVITSFLLACGLKQAGFLRAAMNLVSLVGFVFFISAVGTYAGQIPATDENASQQTSPKNIINSSGILCCLFIQFLELGRRSKGSTTPSKPKIGEISSTFRLPSALGITHAGVLLVTMTLGIVVSFYLNNRDPISGSPLLHALQKIGSADWVRLAMGSFQVVSLGLGMSEAGESVSSRLVAMASDGFVPPLLSKELTSSFSHARAHIATGVVTAILALFFSHSYLLEFLGANVCLLNVLICSVCLYRPFRCSYESLCSVAATRASKKVLSATTRLRTSSTTSLHPERTIHFLKNGLRGLALPRNHDDMDIPLFDEFPSDIQTLSDDTLLTSNADDSNLDLSTSVLELNTDLVIQSTSLNQNELLATETHNSTTEVMNDCELITAVESNSDSEDEMANNNNEWDNFLPEEDIDTIIYEYKEQLRISAKGSKFKKSPTQQTAQRAFTYVLILVFLSSGLSLFSVYIEKSSQTRPDLVNALKVCFVLFTLFAMLITMLVLLQQPKVKTSFTLSGFRLPGSTWIACIALFLNILFATELYTKTIAAALPIHLLAGLWYALYAHRRSAVAKAQLHSSSAVERSTENEMVCLSSERNVPTNLDQSAHRSI